MDYKAKSLSDIVENYLKDQILSAEMKSGDKVVESEIAELLQISRAPVREALRSLSQQGMITFSPRRGHFILEMSREEIFETFQIRITLELQVLRILISNNLLTQEDFRRLGELSNRMRHSHREARSELEQVFLLNSMDIAFHRQLWNASGSVKRAQLLEGLFFHLLIVMNQNIASLGSCKEKSEEHFKMIEALQTNDIDLISHELHQHLYRYIIAALGELSPEEQNVLNILFHF